MRNIINFCYSVNEKKFYSSKWYRNKGRLSNQVKNNHPFYFNYINWDIQNLDNKKDYLRFDLNNFVRFNSNLIGKKSENDTKLETLKMKLSELRNKDKNKDKDKDKDIMINMGDDKFKVFIDDKFRGEELLKLFDFLDEFNISSEDRKRLEDLILIVSHLLSISKFGLSKKVRANLRESLINLFNSIGLDSKKMGDIVNYIDKVKIENLNSKMVNYEDLKNKYNLVKEYNNNNNNNNIKDVKDIKYNINIKNNDDFLLKLIEIADKKNVILSDEMLTDIDKILNLIGMYNYDVITKQVENLMKDLIFDFYYIVNLEHREKRVKRVFKKIPMNLYHYTKDLNYYMKMFLINVQKSCSNYFIEHANNLIELLPSKFKIIFNDIINLHKLNILRLSKKYDNLLNYDRPSMELVKLSKSGQCKKWINDIRLDSILNLDKIINKIDKFLPVNGDLINQNDDQIFSNKVAKLSFYKNPLTMIINDILSDDKLSLVDKQLAIERALLNFDLNWLENEGLYSANVKNTILHDIYNKINRGLNDLLDLYRKNKYIELKNILNKNNLFKLNEGITVVIFMLLGNKVIINVCFKLIIEIIMSRKKDELNNRTEIVFKIAERLIKLVNIGLIKFQNDLLLLNTQNVVEGDNKDDNRKDNKDDKNLYKLNLNINIIDKDNKDVKTILKLWKIDYLIKFINELGSEQKLVLGDSILRLILNKCDLIKELHILSNNETKISLQINDQILHKLTISTINVTQLPMLVKPREPSSEGNYLPYLTPEISHIFNSFDSIIKNKYDNLYPTENQFKIVHSIKYLNNVRFQINGKLLDVIYREFNDPNSLIFKGQNQTRSILEGMTNKEKNEVFSHNSKYWNIVNCLNIAILFVEHSFYLPTFADFRGRIYTLTNYLSYIGNDLARSLLLFDPDNSDNSDDDNTLTNIGFNYLCIYFANLSGRSNLSWNDRLKWTNDNIFEIYSMYINQWEEFNNIYLQNIKEPWQFISILLELGRILYEDDINKPVYVNIPILFDASCSGIQHLSAMTRDIEIARKVNILPEEEFDDEDSETILEKSTAQDYYLYAAQKVQTYLDKSDNIKFNNILLTRELIKRTVMTIPYNVTIYGVKEQLLELIKQIKQDDKIFYQFSPNLTKDNQIMHLLPSEFLNFVDIIYKNLVDIPSLSKLTKYLNKLLKIIMELDLPVIWTAPSGLKIKLSIRKYTTKKTKSNLIEYSKPVTIKLPLNKLDHKKITSGFMPNLIHSLDSSNIHLLIDKLSSEPLYTVHDCFATTPNNMQNLDRMIKETFIQIYFTDGNYLTEMHNILVKQIKDNVSEVFINEKGEEYITIKNKNYIIPQMPIEFTSTQHNKLFMNGIFKSYFFIN